MLLLVTILLVVVGTISLVIGYAQSSLLPIYVSIACSVLAAAVLLIFSRMTAKSQQVVTSDSGPSSLDLGRSEPASRPEPIPAMAGAGLSGRSSGDAFAPDEPPSRYSGALDDEQDEGPEDDFPIERYDSRRVGEILPLLAELDVDELDLVREHEERGKGRATVLARIDQLIDQLEAEDSHEAEHRFDAPAAVAPAGDMHDDALDDLHDDAHDDAHDDVPATPAPPAPTLSVAALPEGDDDYFPIEDYDDLRASEVLPLLPELDDDELEMVASRERAGSARSSILHRVDALLKASGGAPGPVDSPQGMAVEPEPELVPAPPALPPEAPVKRARATKATGARSTKAGSAKAVPTKVAAPIVAPAKAPRAPRAKAVAAVTKVPAKRAAAAKAVPAVTTAPPRKAPVKKAPAAKKASTAAPVAKAAPAKRATKASASLSSTPASKTTKKAAKR
ncbi:MAG: hypothetical protein ABIS47_02010 [Acidimicrobiales bacterium]